MARQRIENWVRDEAAKGRNTVDEIKQAYAAAERQVALNRGITAAATFILGFVPFMHLAWGVTVWNAGRMYTSWRDASVGITDKTVLKHYDRKIAEFNSIRGGAAQRNTAG